MASILKVDTLTGVSTAGSISVTGEGNSTTTNLQQGLAKHRAQHAAGTLQSGSLNCSSIADTGTGAFTHNYSNNFANILYSHFGTGIYNQGGATTLWTYGRKAGAASDTTTSSINCEAVFVNSSSNRTAFDFDFEDLVCFGDLA